MLENIQRAIKEKRHRYTIHAQEQMAVRHITDAEIREAVLDEKSEVIEEYPEDKYSPSCLIYGVTRNERVVHVQSNHQGVIITAYEPDMIRWREDLKTRRK